MNSSEGGRKVTQALNASSRAFGAALFSTKAWFSAMTTTTGTSAVALLEQQQQQQSSTTTKSTKNLDTFNEKCEKQVLDDDNVIEISKLKINNLHDLVIVNNNGEVDD
jgi:hypothetical protein